ADRADGGRRGSPPASRNDQGTSCRERPCRSRVGARNRISTFPQAALRRVSGSEPRLRQRRRHQEANRWTTTSTTSTASSPIQKEARKAPRCPGRLPISWVLHGLHGARPTPNPSA